MSRPKDVINISRVKFETNDVQMAVDQALGLLAVRAMAFPARASGMATAQVVVAYIPECWPLERSEVIDIDNLAVQACPQHWVTAIDLCYW